MKDLERIRYIELGGIEPLYAPGGDTIRAELASVVLEITETPEKWDAVVLTQACSDQNIDPQFVQQLQKTVFLDELVENLFSFRVLLENIRMSPTPWIYVANADLLGSHCELAFACHERIAMSDRVRIGFPELFMDNFPPGGSLEFIPKSMPKREEWLASPVIKITDIGKGVVFLRGEPDRSAILKSWLVKNMSKITSKRREEGEVSPTGANVERETALKLALEMEQEWLEGKGSAELRENYLQAYLQLIKRKGKFASSQDFGWLAALMAAQRMLHAETMIHLRDDAVRNNVAKKLDTMVTDHQICAQLITIDLDRLPPPVAMVASLLRNQHQIVFVCSAANPLAVALALIYPRLDRFFTPTDLQMKWNSLVSWGQFDSPVRAGLRLTYSVGDLISVSTESEEFSMTAIEGNHIDAPLGMIEVDSKFQAIIQRGQMLRLLKDISRTVALIPPVTSAQIPISYFVRTLFFEELLRLAKSSRMELTALVELLGEAGWGFGGNDSAWDRFLKTRYESVMFPADVYESFGRAEGRSEWELGSWKQARSFVKQSKTKADQNVTWSRTAVSHHLSLYLGLIADYIVREIGRDYRDEVNLVCQSALGMPSNISLPTQYLEDCGNQRVQFYGQKHWQTLIQNLPGSS